jgi:glutamate-1-semialdehyde 2,1-aminomutase
MEKLSPLGPVYQAGTLSGNPVAMAAGLATMKLIEAPGFYQGISVKVERLVNGIMAEAKKAGIPMSENHVGGMFGLFFTEEQKITSYGQAVDKCDAERFKKFFHGMLHEGVYLAPSAFEAGFVSSAHTDADIDATIAAAGRVLATL